MPTASINPLVSQGESSCRDGLAPELCDLPSPAVMLGAVVAAVLLTVLAVAAVYAAVLAARRNSRHG